jgi:ribonuclease Z
MDEDERLLASEEGKKLSSKERRQLRNKVSARAFRSRRKEYIGQLEGELSAKGQEADDLRTENEALKAENTRLTDLTRMLLASPAFSTFLNELSNNPSAAALPSAPASAPAPVQPSNTNQQVRKDANPHRQQQMQQPGDTHVGMTFMPETTLDFSAFEPVNAWGPGMDFGFNAQVFSVTELPQGPTIDAGILSGKTSNFLPTYASDEAKDGAPAIERMPEPAVVSAVPVADVPVVEEAEFDESDPAFALYMDTPTAAPKPNTPTEPEFQIFGGVQLEKAFARLDLVVDDENVDEDDTVSAATMARFEAICSSLDAASARIEAVTRHL